MFPNLNAEMAREKMSIKRLAEIANIQYDSLKNKMRGDTEFRRDEMYRIKKNAFPNFTVDYLFKAEEKGEW